MHSDEGLPLGLHLSGLSAGYYGRAVVFDINLRAAQGEVTAIFGHNGAGKTTTLRSVAGLVQRLAGQVRVCGADLSSRSPHAIFGAGLVYLPQDHATFPALSVLENLEIGALDSRRAERRARLRRVFDTFPILDERQRSKARVLSGGQQRMLSIGCALMSDARVILLDEPSLGLAPSLTQSLLSRVRDLAHQDGRTIVLVEQSIGDALAVADRVYVIRSGTVIADMTRPDALQRSDWSDVY